MRVIGGRPRGVEQVVQLVVGYRRADPVLDHPTTRAAGRHSLCHGSTLLALRVGLTSHESYLASSRLTRWVTASRASLGSNAPVRTCWTAALSSSKSSWAAGITGRQRAT